MRIGVSSYVAGSAARRSLRTQYSQRYYTAAPAVRSRLSASGQIVARPQCVTARMARLRWYRKYPSLSPLSWDSGRKSARVQSKRVFDLVIDFGTSQSPKSTRPLTTYLCHSRPGHQALRNNFASSLLLRTCLPMTGRRVWMPTLLPLWRYAHDG